MRTYTVRDNLGQTGAQEVHLDFYTALEYNMSSSVLLYAHIDVRDDLGQRGDQEVHLDFHIATEL